jgi:hypothetical protein
MWRGGLFSFQSHNLWVIRDEGYTFGDGASLFVLMVPYRELTARGDFRPKSCRWRRRNDHQLPDARGFQRADLMGGLCKEGILCTIAAACYQRNQVVATLLQRHVLLRECVAGDVTNVKYLSGHGVRRIQFIGVTPKRSHGFEMQGVSRSLTYNNALMSQSRQRTSHHDQLSDRPKLFS